MQKIASILRQLSWSDVFGMTLVTILLGVFASFMLSVDVPFMQFVGFAFASAFGFTAVLSLMMSAIVVFISR